MKLKQVINIFGGPGVGKSTTAAGLFYQMKSQGYNVEYVTEYAKQLTYDERYNVLDSDQLYIFAKQHRKIYRLLGKCEYIITDSPLILSIMYFRLNPEKMIYNYLVFDTLVKDTFDKYPNINILLKRNSRHFYQVEGRTQSKEQAKSIDIDMKNLMLGLNVEFSEILSGTNAVKNIFNKVRNA